MNGRSSGAYKRSDVCLVFGRCGRLPSFDAINTTKRSSLKRIIFAIVAIANFGKLLGSRLTSRWYKKGLHPMNFYTNMWYSSRTVGFVLVTNTNIRVLWCKHKYNSWCRSKQSRTPRYTNPRAEEAVGAWCRTRHRNCNPYSTWAALNRLTFVLVTNANFDKPE